MTKHRSRFSIFNAIFIYFIFLTKTIAQPGTGENHYAYSFGINTFKGFVMPHNEGVRHLAYGRPTGTEMYFNWASDGSKPWHHRYGLPEAGVSLTYFNTDMPPTGNLWSAMTYMDLFLLKKSYLQVTFRIGTGLTYSNTLYNQENNNLNVMISSPISYNMQGRIGLRVPVHDRFYIDSGLTLSHASNGAVVLPNSGINMVTANFGLAYRWVPMDLISESEEDEINRDIGFDFLFSATLRDPVRNQGTTETFTFESPIYEIAVHDEINLVLHNGSPQRFELVTGENMVPDVKVTRKDGRLTIKNQNGCKWSRNPGNVNFHVYTDTLVLLEKYTVGSVTSEEALEYSFTMETLAAGEIDLVLDNRAIQINLGLLNNVTLSGRTFALGLYMIGGDGRFSGENLEATRANVIHNGINEVHLNVSERLNYYLWNDGDIILHREPDVIIEEENIGRGNIALSREISDLYCRLLKEKGVEAELIDLQELPDDFIASALYDKSGDNEDFNPMRKLMKDAHKMIFIVPEYNGSFPGVLKTFIDGLEYPNTFRNKKCALVGLSSGVQGGGLALSHLTDIFNYCGMHVLALKPKLAKIDAFYRDGVITNKLYNEL
ncbi:unnamed protein product, partial [Symbiodinium microadriaticum]